jgi:amyloid beta precursor protein binding protein 1
LFFCFSFIGTIRLQSVEHYIIEAHPDDTIPDLRLDRPLKSFRNHCDAIDFQNLTREEHLHLPSLVILYKALQQWQKQTNRTDLPRIRKEKDEFKKILDELSHHSAYDDNDTNKILENFEEAKRTIPSRLVNTQIPSTINDLFQDRSCLELSNQSHIFWFLINAIKLFTQNEGQGLLPVRGEVPDMITNTNSYVKLVEIYQEQAKKDCEIIQNYFLDLLKKHNRFSTMSNNEQASLHELVHIYCKNAAFLKVIRTTSIKNEDDLLQKQIQQISFDSSTDEPEADICWYIGLRLCDTFYQKFNRYPGEFPLSINEMDTDQRQLEIDLNDLKQIGKQLINSDKQQGPIRENILEELCRYGASELHSISAFIGGCCAQEAIKLITHQYVPIDHVLVYNSIRQSTSVFKL